MAAIAPGIEDADLHLWLAREREQLLIASDTVRVINEDPHPHTALRGVLQGLRDQAPGFIAAKNVVLQIKRAPGLRDQLKTQQ